jgi:iron-sulfur cluster repair protein YtfE (RIC family)
MTPVLTTAQLLSFSDNSDVSNNKTIQTLIEQHRLFVEKLIPEIELHLIELTANCYHSNRLTLLVCLKWLSNFGKNLKQHIEYEEAHVFPALAKHSESLSEKASSFIEHHDDFELQLQNYLTQIKNSLTHLSSEMSFRILLLKLEMLHEAMLEHAELEKSIMV